MALDFDKLFDTPEVKKASVENKDLFDTFDEESQDMFESLQEEATPIDIEVEEFEDYLGEGFDPTTDVEERRAQAQGNFNKVMKTVPRIATKIVSEVAKIPGEIYGLAEWARTDFDPAQFEESLNNVWIDSIDKAYNKTNDELFAVHKRKVIEQGGFLRQVVSPEFWATEGADGVGFLVSMFAPGIAVKALGVGSKISKGLMKTAKIIKPGTAMRIGSNIDDFTAAGINTLVESTIEGMEAAESTKRALYQNRITDNIESGMGNEEAITEADTYIDSEQTRTIIGKSGAGTVATNMAILIGPNILDQKWLFNGFNKASRVASKAKRTKLGEAIGKIEESGKYLKKFYKIKRKIAKNL